MSTVVLDCRWLGLGGAGRAAELILRALPAVRAPHHWVLWGPPGRLSGFAWPGAVVVPTSFDPRRAMGQGHWRSVPQGDLVVFMHQQRPLRRVRALTFIHDSIALRNARGAIDRSRKRIFLERVAAISEQVITPSHYARDCLRRDLGLAEEHVSVLHYPADVDLADRVLRLRNELPRADRALYVGLFGPHKNLRRLLAAFTRSQFAQGGGRLLLVGGTSTEISDLTGRLTPAERACTDIRPRCPQGELEELLATSLFLVQPSLEEGFGLPVWEALTCGLPVCVSNQGSLPEITRGTGTVFAPTSTEDMSCAIDRCAEEAHRNAVTTPAASAAFISSAPTLESFAAEFLGIVGPRLP